tara:strand:+ start:409 stop:2118 length:1710 start_codon:yes stop_codon:yes gene_type:complete
MPYDDLLFWMDQLPEGTKEHNAVWNEIETRAIEQEGSTVRDILNPKNEAGEKVDEETALYYEPQFRNLPYQYSQGFRDVEGAEIPMQDLLDDKKPRYENFQEDVDVRMDDIREAMPGQYNVWLNDAQKVYNHLKEVAPPEVAQQYLNRYINFAETHLADRTPEYMSQWFDHYFDEGPEPTAPMFENPIPTDETIFQEYPGRDGISMNTYDVSGFPHNFQSKLASEPMSIAMQLLKGKFDLMPMEAANELLAFSDDPTTIRWHNDKYGLGLSEEGLSQDEMDELHSHIIDSDTAFDPLVPGGISHAENVEQYEQESGKQARPMGLNIQLGDVPIIDPTKPETWKDGPGTTWVGGKPTVSPQITQQPFPYDFDYIHQGEPMDIAMRLLKLESDELELTPPMTQGVEEQMPIQENIPMVDESMGGGYLDCDCAERVREYEINELNNEIQYAKSLIDYPEEARAQWISDTLNEIEFLENASCEDIENHYHDSYNRMCVSNEFSEEDQMKYAGEPMDLAFQFLKAPTPFWRDDITPVKPKPITQEDKTAPCPYCVVSYESCKECGGTGRINVNQ